MDDEKNRIDELLTMLDLPEEELMNWVDDNIDQQGYEHKDEFISTESLADLAFRLRDEVVGLKEIEKTDDDFVIEHKLLRKAQVRVFEYVNTKTIDYRNPPQEYFIWWLEQAQPIYWIIVALIAKELAKESR